VPAASGQRRRTAPGASWRRAAARRRPSGRARRCRSTADLSGTIRAAVTAVDFSPVGKRFTLRKPSPRRLICRTGDLGAEVGPWRAQISRTTGARAPYGARRQSTDHRRRTPRRPPSLGLAPAPPPPRDRRAHGGGSKTPATWLHCQRRRRTPASCPGRAATGPARLRRQDLRRRHRPTAGCAPSSTSPRSVHDPGPTLEGTLTVQDLLSADKTPVAVTGGTGPTTARGTALVTDRATADDGRHHAAP
jgi:hypothetical protein